MYCQLHCKTRPSVWYSYLEAITTLFTQKPAHLAGFCYICRCTRPSIQAPRKRSSRPGFRPRRVLLPAKSSSTPTKRRVRKRKGAAPISSANADIYRMVATWWLYGPRAVREATTLKSRCNLLHPIFVLCTREGIVASDLASHPNVVDAIGGLIQPSRWGEALQLLHVLYEQRDQLGFTLLDRESLRRMEAASPDHQTRQTSYMPPRIWADRKSVV